MTDARTGDRHTLTRPGIIMFVAAAIVASAIALVVARPFAPHRADLSSYPSGVTAADVNRASALAANSNVPAAIMAAIPQSYGTDPTQPARSWTTAQRTAAIRDNTPIGPYQLVYNNVYAFARAYKILPLSFNEMADPQRSGNWLVGAIEAVIHRKGLSTATANFLAGTTDQPWFNPQTNVIEQRTTVATAAGASARAGARSTWISILSALPISAIGSHATGIYAGAFHWTVVGSLSQVCGGVPLTYGNADVIPVPGNWANPVASTKILTGFSATGHSGVDLATTAGAPVYAATSGVVQLTGSNTAVAAAGGTHSLVIYTGNSLTLAYQDLATDAVADGQQVRVGQLLGTVAATPTDNASTGPHLHFGINTVHAYASNHLTWVDPVAFMKARGINLGTSTVGSPLHVVRTAGTSVRTTQAASATQGLTDLWQGSQLSTATTLISIGQHMRVPTWGIQTAIMTAMRGSRLGNELPPASGSPRGVLALPNAWGSVAARSDLATAAQMFYTRLLAVPGWQTMPPWAAASKAGAYGGAVVDTYRAMWSGAGIIMNVLGTPGTTSTYGTAGTVGGGCTGAATSGTPTVNLSSGFRVSSFNLHGCTASGTTGPDGCVTRFPAQWSYL
ncbi:MAG TPA: M23 family metallopeptidase, partial [Nocardioides sp.]|nr:M23 family metallopeptidase [Nocardioides sp.]